QVDGGGKNLLFSSFGGPGISIGANGLKTTGDIAVNAGGGTLAGTGTISGNRVQLIAGAGIGAPTARIGTAAGTLAARSSGGSAFIAETDDVTLASVLFAGSTISNGVGPGRVFDLSAGGA